MKKVIVTGPTSMIGLATINECLKNNVSVLAIVRENTTRLDRLPKSDLIKIINCNIDKLDSIDTNNLDSDYDVFYHFAWGHTAKAERDNPLMQEQNVKYTLDAVKLASTLGCKKFIGAGSQAEYGMCEEVRTEDTLEAPLTSYGISKYSAKMLSRRMCDQLGMVHVWGRIFSVYGPHDNEGTMLNYGIDCFINGEKAKFSSATQMWNYLYEDDAGSMFYLLGEKNVESGVYCVAGKESDVLRKYIECMRDEFGTEAICEFAPITPNVKNLGLEVKIDKIVNATGFLPKVSFNEGIKKMIEFRKNIVKKYTSVPSH